MSSDAQHTEIASLNGGTSKFLHLTPSSSSWRVPRGGLHSHSKKPFMAILWRRGELRSRLGLSRVIGGMSNGPSHRVQRHASHLGEAPRSLLASLDYPGLAHRARPGCYGSLSSIMVLLQLLYPQIMIKITKRDVYRAIVSLSGRHLDA